MEHDDAAQDGLAGWCYGMAECIMCGHEWIAVWPLGAEALECPSCSSDDTDRTAE